MAGGRAGLAGRPGPAGGRRRPRRPSPGPGGRCWSTWPWCVAAGAGRVRGVPARHRDRRRRASSSASSSPSPPWRPPCPRSACSRAWPGRSRRNEGVAIALAGGAAAAVPVHPGGQHLLDPGVRPGRRVRGGRHRAQHRGRPRPACSTWATSPSSASAPTWAPSPATPCSPTSNFHIPFLLVVLVVAPVVAAVFGVLLGAPTLRLRGDYLAIVTLGFGEIFRITAQQLGRPHPRPERHLRRSPTRRSAAGRLRRRLHRRRVRRSAATPTTSTCCWC